MIMENGCFVVELLFKENMEQLANNESTAMKCYLSNEKFLENNELSYQK